MAKFRPEKAEQSSESQLSGLAIATAICRLAGSANARSMSISEGLIISRPSRAHESWLASLRGSGTKFAYHHEFDIIGAQSGAKLWIIFQELFVVIIWLLGGMAIELKLKALS